MKEVPQISTPESSISSSVLLSPKPSISPTREGMGPWVKVEPKKKKKKPRNKVSENLNPAPPAAKNSSNNQHPSPTGPKSNGAEKISQSDSGKSKSLAGPFKASLNATQSSKLPVSVSQNGKIALSATGSPSTTISNGPVSSAWGGVIATAQKCWGTHFWVFNYNITPID